MRQSQEWIENTRRPSATKVNRPPWPGPATDERMGKEGSQGRGGNLIRGQENRGGCRRQGLMGQQRHLAFRLSYLVCEGQPVVGDDNEGLGPEGTGPEGSVVRASGL